MNPIRRLALPAFLLLASCDPATLAALTPLATAGMGVAEAAVRDAASRSGNPNAPEWKAAIDAAAKADRKHAEKLAEAEKKRDAADDKRRREEHAEVMRALASCGAGATDAGSEAGR